MPSQALPTNSPSPLWAIQSYNLNEKVEPDGHWQFDNRRRSNKGIVIFQYSTKGRMLYRDRLGEQKVGPGQAVLFTLDEESWYGLPIGFKETYHTRFMSLQGTGLVEHWNFIRQRFGSVVTIGGNNLLLTLMRQLCERPRPRSGTEAAATSAAVYAFVMRLYATLDECWTRENSPVERAVRELLAHTTTAWSLKEVALRHGCSREHLTRVFTLRNGNPPATFLVDAKINKALELLRETALTIRQVAEQSGFLSRHTLARQIRRKVGISPGEYREREKARLRGRLDINSGKMKFR